MVTEGLTISLDALLLLTSRENLMLYVDLAEQYNFSVSLALILKLFTCRQTDSLENASLTLIVINHISVLTGFSSSGKAGGHIHRLLANGVVDSLVSVIIRDDSHCEEVRSK